MLRYLARSNVSRLLTTAATRTTKRQIVQASSAPRVDTEIKRSGKVLSIGGDNFHVDWLRHNCQCHHCIDVAGQKLVDASDLHNLAISSATVKSKLRSEECKYGLFVMTCCMTACANSSLSKL